MKLTTSNARKALRSYLEIGFKLVVFLATESSPCGSVMNRSLAFWVGFVSAFVASGLALRVAFRLGLAAHSGGLSFVNELGVQSKWAAVAGLAALLSAIAQIIEKASR